MAVPPGHTALLLEVLVARVRLVAIPSSLDRVAMEAEAEGHGGEAKERHQTDLIDRFDEHGNTRIETEQETIAPP